METLLFQPPLLGESRAIDDLRDFIIAVSLREDPVLLTGPAGTGKSLAAGKIHAIGPNAPSPCRRFHAGELDVARVEEIFSSGGSGSLFVRDADQLSAEMIARLTDPARREDGSPRVILGSRLAPEDLGWEGARAAGFDPTSDCPHRAIPPLRERVEDIPLISRYQFWLHTLPDRFEAQWAAFEAGFLPCLLRHDWPGNVAELISVVVDRCGGDTGIPRRWAGEQGRFTAQEEFIRSEFEAAFEALRAGLVSGQFDGEEWLLPRPLRNPGECDAD